MKRQASDLLRFVLVLLAGVSLLLGIENALDRNGSQDFQWGPSRVLLQGKNPYTPYIEYRKGFTQVNPYLLTQVPFYPASGYVFLWPYAALDWRAAKVAWALSNVALSFLLLAGLRRVLPVRRDIQEGRGRHRAYRPGYMPRLEILRKRVPLQEALLQLGQR